MSFYALQMSLQGIFDSPFGMFIPIAVQVAMLVSNIQASTAFIQCLFLPHTAASATVAMPFPTKNSPIRVKALLSRIGWRAYMWKTAMSANAPRTPKERATTTGTPCFGSPYLNGLYARDVQGEANALCHDSDLLPRLIIEEIERRR